MPFTPTHILAVTPLMRWRGLPFSAAAIGTMTPDFPLFFNGLVSYDATHSFAGVITVCAPLGVTLWLLWERVLRAPLLALAPNWVIQRAQVSPSRWPRLTGVLTAVACVAFGALTHVVWDAFTHYGRWGVALVPYLDQSTAIAGRSIPNFKLLQYGSTIIGLPALLWVAWRALAAAAPAAVVGALPSPARAVVSGGLIGGAIVVGMVRAFASGASVHVGAFQLVTAGGATLALLALAWACVFHLTWRSPTTPA